MRGLGRGAKTKLLAIAIVAAFTAALGACSSSENTIQGDDGCVGVECLPDIVGEPDSGTPPLVEDIKHYLDMVQTVDAKPTPDVSDVEALADGGADSDEPQPVACRTASDCESGYCVEDPDSGAWLCAPHCVNTCPWDWECRTVSLTWPDVVSICFPPVNRQCQPCEQDADCGNPADRCLAIGQDESAPTFCARGCAQTGVCPAGNTCTEIIDDGGAVLGEHCLPDSGSCVCTDELDGTRRPCERANEFGTCFGDELCDGGRGWVDCTAPEPSPEACNGVDDDCDDAIDEAFGYADWDGTERALGEECGTGLCAGGVVVCADDESATCSGLSQQAEEVCNALDDDCDGETDEGVAETFYRDFDGDGQGTPELTETGCQAPEGFVANADDCNDHDRNTGLGFPELCDSRDNDCDGLTDDDIDYAAPDGALLPLGAPCGHGLCAGGVVICAGETGAACSTAGYARDETCDGRDENCDGILDDGCDDDGDGYCDGDLVVAGLPDVCPEGPGDCDDHDEELNPSAAELCDGVDQDCDGVTDEEVTDCAPAGCDGGGEDYFEVGAAECREGSCVAPEHVGCGLFTCDGGGVEGERCARVCVDDTVCVPSAHCDKALEICIPDIQNGGPCDADADCVSGHCANGFCCADGDCCAMPSNCSLATYGEPRVCDDPATCQGHRRDPACVDNMCAVGERVEDDSACTDEVMAIDCDPGIPLFCTGALEQEAPACSDVCASDADCREGYHCNERCVPDLPDGQPCVSGNECVSGYCANGFCCASGDCCGTADDCPGEYHQPPVCDDDATCEGHRVDAMCTDAMCASSVPVPDDSGCTAAVEANACGPYLSVHCTGEFSQRAPECPTACVDDSDCDADAHCDGECVPDLANGERCDEPSDCESGHCANGFCCGAGVCCVEPGDCGDEFREPPVCDDAVTCQGHRVDAVCADNVCQPSGDVPDDSACGAAQVADDCGLFVNVHCSGAAVQEAPVCATVCTADDECDPGAHCDGVCRADLVDGSACDEDSDCESGHCANGFCCADGDCCAAAADCPQSYEGPAVCDDGASCQGHRVDAACQANRCVSVDVDDDSACGTDTISDECGLFLPVRCSGARTQSAPPCPASCGHDDECDPGAHCDGTCVDDSGNGGVCDEDTDCASGHCQNSRCCASGDCCAVAADCPATYSAAPVCDDSAGCQGHRVDPVCADFQCSSLSVDDDSGCGASVVSDGCGAYPAVTCSGQVNQHQPSCADWCAVDADCDDNAHCDANRCVVDLEPGGGCDEDSDCQGGLYCVDGVCCTSQCNGLCRRCDVAGHEGTCWNVPVGQDPNEECGSLSCWNYYWGWDGDTCFRKSNAPSSAVGCDGAGACQVASAVCPTHNVQGVPYTTCDGFCQDPHGGSCTGTAPGTCDNVDQGSETCGTGACQVSAPRCLNGAANECIPLTSGTETCNDIDDDCDGDIDEGIAGIADDYESNNTCAAREDLGTIAQEASGASFVASLYPAGDEDWFRIYADENDDICVPFASQSFSLTIRMTPPNGPGDCVDYDLYVYDDGCPADPDNDWLARPFRSSCTEEEVVIEWSGTCLFNDSKEFWLRVKGWSGASECVDYDLWIDMDGD